MENHSIGALNDVPDKVYHFPNSDIPGELLGRKYKRSALPNIVLEWAELAYLYMLFIHPLVYTDL